MKLRHTYLAAALGGIAVFAACKQNPKAGSSLHYLMTKMDTTVFDDYYGTKVTDPYRWLENDTAPEVAAWVDSQNNFTFSYLEQIPYRKQLKDRLTELFNYEKISAPFKEGDYIYHFRNNGLQNQSVLYRTKEGGAEEIFLDPNTLSSDGTTSLGGMSFTKDGKLCAYSLSKAGADWQEIVVIDAITKKETGDRIPNVKFTGISWRNNVGFYYSRYDDAKGSKLSGKTENHKVYFHVLGSDPAKDQLVFGDDKNPKRYVGATVTDDGEFLVIQTAMATSGNELLFMQLNKAIDRITYVVNNFDNDHEVINSRNGKLYVLTNLNAPNRRLVEIDPAKPQPENWKDIIPHSDNVLEVSTGGDKLFAKYLKDAVSQVVQYNYNGTREKEIALPGPGSVYGFAGKKDETEIYYSFTSFLYPVTIYKYKISDGTSTLYKQPSIKFDFNAYESKQVFYKSKDGTKIPMTITHKKGLKLDGKNPTLLYGYGGFNISLTPNFSPNVLVLLEQGGVYAVANIRGGGEYGEQWHTSGTKMQKQNVFDDFISAANYLVEQKYTSNNFLAISGGSNGGLLVGAVLTQQPQLVKVAFPAVGVLDMLRYHTFTAGAGWATDYGTAQDSKEMFEYLHKYSPLHNVKKAAYPAVMITTGDHDDRVVPAHSFKFAATLQASQQGENPVLIRIDKNAGHGAGKPTAKIIEEAADKWAFMFWNMDVKTLHQGS